MPKCRKGKVIENRIGKRYEKAGYRVQYRKRIPEGEIDFIAKRKREKIAGEVKHSAKRRTVSSSEGVKNAKEAIILPSIPCIRAIILLNNFTEMNWNIQTRYVPSHFWMTYC